MRILSGGGIHVHADDPRAGKALVEFFLHLLRTRSHWADIDALTGRTIFRHRLDGPAIMAAKGLIHAVIRHGYIAVIAFDGFAAFPAAYRTGIPSAIQKQHGLLAFSDTFFQLLRQQPGKHAVIAPAQFFPHIHQMNGRHGAILYPVGHFHQDIISSPGHGIGINAWGGAGKEHHGPLPLSAGSGNFPGVILRKALGKIRLLMLFIHNDGAQIFNRRKYRRPGANYNSGKALSDSAPFVKSLAGGKPGMQHRHSIPKPGAEPIDHLWRQHNFRHQNDGALSHFQGFSHQTDINLGFPGACDPMEQKWLLGLLQGRKQFGKDFRLFRRQFRIRRRIYPSIEGRAERFLLHNFRHFLFNQIIKRITHIADHAPKFFQRMILAIGKQRNQQLSFIGSSLLLDSFVNPILRNQKPGVFLGLDLDSSAAHFGRQHQAQRLAKRAMASFPDLPRQFHQLRKQGGIILQC